ncbi:MAG: hypothetical protein AAFX96_08740 [Pseudomonadota bacterium]
MIAIAWLVGLALFIALLFNFPRRTSMIGGAVIGVVLLVLTGVLIYDYFEKQEERARLKQINTTAVYSPETCSSDKPIALTIENGTDRTVVQASFIIQGLRTGYSNALYDSGFAKLTSDKILAPGESHTSCWAVPKVIVSIAKSVLEENPPETLDWSIKNFIPVFE